MNGDQFFEKYELNCKEQNSVLGTPLYSSEVKSNHWDGGGLNGDFEGNLKDNIDE